MRKILTLFVALFVALFIAAPTATASSPHFKKGGEPVCTISISGSTATASCTGSLSGLGNEDMLITTTLSGFAVYQCQNPGGNLAPGQNKVVTGPESTPTPISGGQIKNGNLTFTATGSLHARSQVSAAEAGCPNGGWTGVNPTLTVTSITLTIEQPVGTVLFTCTASNSSGLSGSVTLSC